MAINPAGRACGSGPIRRFPHLVFYFERPDWVDVVRVLHGSRDIPSALGARGRA
jgi:plasmid stabilization system protein ParE